MVLDYSVVQGRGYLSEGEKEISQADFGSLVVGER